MEINIGSIVLEDELNFGNIKLDTVKVYPELENLEITPSKEEQTFKSQNYYGYDEVKVAGITNEVDENIKPENIKKDVSILGVTGNVEEINTTEISISPISEEQVITPEAPYNGFSKVTVGAQSGVDINDYFETTLTNNNKSNFGKLNFSKKVPKVNVASDVTDMLNAFSYYSLTVAPEMDLSNVVNLGYLFSYSNSLKYAPTYDLSSCIQTSGFFYSCSELLSFNFINTSKVKYMSSMFTNTKIKELCFMDTSNVIEMDFMCTNCKQLLEFPSFDTSKVTSMRSILSGCSSLIRVGNIDTSNVTNMSSAFQNCPNLITIPKLNASKATNIANVVNTNTSLRDFGGLENLGQAYLTTASANYSDYTLTVQYCKNLTYDSLMNVINNLYDIASIGVQPQKLVLGSTNLAKLNATEEGQQAIASAQNKGWTVS